ncbi:hypothetical protein DSO57_1026153 [Entomophthora muscae]|uniref:Uncharacterized protein n=1 Tax=Entomophthora muscae TaxID=34485 RepID=A0ACC2UB78_9FUNG|nr:hypothetical protein DSO57_1026153 [Entomophthora muscae]
MNEDAQLADVGFYLGGMAGKWHDSQKFLSWEKWKIAVKEQFDNFEGNYLNQITAIKMQDFTLICRFLTNGNAKDAVEASFSKQCIKFLAQASTPAYGQLIQLEKFANLEAAFIGIMDQYKEAVENKLDEVSPQSYEEAATKYIEISHKSQNGAKHSKAPSPNTAPVVSISDTPIRKTHLEQSLVLSPVEDEPVVYTENDNLTPIPNYMLSELTKVTPDPTYTQEAQPKPKQPGKKTPTAVEPEVNIPMELLDKKVRKILAQVMLEEELPHNTPNVERYMGFFSPPNQNKVTVETVEETPKQACQPGAPLSP